jgi:hypothetical protein
MSNYSEVTATAERLNVGRDLVLEWIAMAGAFELGRLAAVVIEVYTRSYDHLTCVGCHNAFDLTLGAQPCGYELRSLGPTPSVSGPESEP